jgi:AmmeMemoRadiSam system protein B
MFYPAQAQVLTDTVRQLLAGSPVAAPSAASTVKALIVPHAGYIYSGPTAARAYAMLAPLGHSIRRVVLLGPVHRVAVRGLAVPGAQSFATPLGNIALDQSGIASIAKLPQVVVSPQAHALEHSLEVQLPFLQTVLQDFTLIPLAVGDATPDEVAEVLETLWGGPETLIVISSDLSHYLPYGAAQVTDRQTVAQILRLHGPLSHHQACGATPINGMLLAACAHAMHPQLLDQCNSGDTAGDRQRVVGYAALAFTEATHDPH